MSTPSVTIALLQLTFELLEPESIPPSSEAPILVLFATETEVMLP
jgi:hypothetical protein